jgi:hypothetical protein
VSEWSSRLRNCLCILYDSAARRSNIFAQLFLPLFCDDSISFFYRFVFTLAPFCNAESDKGHSEFAFRKAGGGKLLRINFSAGLSSRCLPHRPQHGPSTHRARACGPPREWCDGLGREREWGGERDLAGAIRMRYRSPPHAPYAQASWP